MNLYPSITAAINATADYLLSHGTEFQSKSWQGTTPPDAMFEAFEWSFSCPIPEFPTLDRDIKPNLPWADLQFRERVGGVPLNPGESYKVWPYYKNNKGNDKFRTEQEKFSHTYMERFWPAHGEANSRGDVLRGIRYEYGDLSDVIALLKKDSGTRQAFLPIWFPEDTGAKHGGRVPCTLGYLFYIRDGRLNITYYIRACDFLRHFRDDVYLAMCLAYHVVSKLNEPWTDHLSLGIFTMHIANLHVFAKEKNLIKK